MNPDEFYVYKPGLREGRPAILKRSMRARRTTKMVYTEDPAVGRTTEFIAVEETEQVRLLLTDEQVTELARQALVIEEHYGGVRWTSSGVSTGPTVACTSSRPAPRRCSRAPAAPSRSTSLASRGTVRVEGRAIGAKIGAGPVRVLADIDRMHDFVPGEVLVADMTDPDWEPIMKRASAIERCVAIILAGLSSCSIAELAR